jgi:hypothetical protein
MEHRRTACEDPQQQWLPDRHSHASRKINRCLGAPARGPHKNQRKNLQLQHEGLGFAGTEGAAFTLAQERKSAAGDRGSRARRKLAKCKQQDGNRVHGVIFRRNNTNCSDRSPDCTPVDLRTGNESTREMKTRPKTSALSRTKKQNKRIRAWNFSGNRNTWWGLRNLSTKRKPGPSDRRLGRLTQEWRSPRPLAGKQRQTIQELAGALS